MRSFFKFIRNLFLIALVAFGVWTYKNSPNLQMATQDSLATLNNRLNQLIATGTISTANPTKTNTDKTQTDASTKSRIWSKPEANVYVDIQNNSQLYSAAIDAMTVWNRTGAFTFRQVDSKKSAQIVISVVDDSDTNAAGETATTYNPTTGHLLKATVHLNRYYLQNEWYGYSYSRIVNTAEHELGHAIGLNHTSTVSVMYPKGSIYTIQPQDIKNVKKLYHES